MPSRTCLFFRKTHCEGREEEDARRAVLLCDACVCVKKRTTRKKPRKCVHKNPFTRSLFFLFPPPSVVFMEEVLEEGTLSGMPVATETVVSTTEGVAPTAEDNIVSNIRDYIRLDNMRARLSEEIKQLRDPSKSLKNSITQYMVSKTIMRIPIKKNGDEFIELKTKVKTRKPTRDEMVNNLRLLMQSNEVLDKSPEEIMETIMTPVPQEETYDLCRKCKRKRKKTAASNAASISAASCNVHCLRDLMTARTEDTLVLVTQEQQQMGQAVPYDDDANAFGVGGEGVSGEGAFPPFKRRHV